MAADALDQQFMQQALLLAQQAQAAEEVPVGALIVHRQQIIAQAFNQPIHMQDPSAHAEIVALRQAAAVLNNYRLLDTTLYVTLEPCAMCAGAMLHARVKRVVFGAYDPKAGAVGSVINLFKDYAWNHRIEYQGGVLAEACGKLLKDFFQQRR
jgi:tRNA(adenine34) deaminase